MPTCTVCSLFEPIHIQACRQNHVKNRRFFVFLTSVWIHSHTRISSKPRSKIEQNANLAVCSAAIHIWRCRQNHVQKSAVFRVFNVGLGPFTYGDVVNTTLRNQRFLAFLPPVWSISHIKAASLRLRHSPVLLAQAAQHAKSFYFTAERRASSKLTARFSSPVIAEQQ